MSLYNSDPEQAAETAPQSETPAAAETVQTPEVKEPRRKYAAPSAPRVLNCMQPDNSAKS